jgi:hypothetical protein
MCPWCPMCIPGTLICWSLSCRLVTRTRSAAHHLIVLSLMLMHPSTSRPATQENRPAADASYTRLPRVVCKAVELCHQLDRMALGLSVWGRTLSQLARSSSRFYKYLDLPMFQLVVLGVERNSLCVVNSAAVLYAAQHIRRSRWGC